jgi:hypothetical protein
MERVFEDVPFAAPTVYQQGIVYSVTNLKQVVEHGRRARNLYTGNVDSDSWVCF